MKGYEFDYQAFVLMDPKEQEAYLEICESMLRSGVATIVVNGPDSGKKFDRVDELKEWLTLE